jgi:hypothetical protein
MHSKPSPRAALPLLFAGALFAPATTAAGNSAAAIAAGGLTPRRDARLTAAKEVVHISDSKVTVDYELRNDTSADIVSEIEFAVPPYENEWDAMDPAMQSFRTFKVWAGGKPIEYQTEAKAEVNGRDVTKILREAGIDIASFGHLELGRDQHGAEQRIWVADYERLPQKERHHLENEGIFRGEEGYCVYTVHLAYHWTQSFPAHKTVHLHEEFVPAVGFTQAPPDPRVFQAELMPSAGQPGARPANSQSGRENPLGGFCADTTLVGTLLRAHKAFAESWGVAIIPHWVDFDLISQTAWHKPIEDFTLIVDVPQAENGQQMLVSFCAPGVVDKHDPEHLQVHLTKYTAGANLHVGFFNVPQQVMEEPVAAR